MASVNYRSSVNNVNPTEKRYIYFMTDRNRSAITIGISDNLVHTINAYRNSPALFFDYASNQMRLVYFEEFTNNMLLQKRYDFLKMQTKAQKEKLIRSVNADWVDLSLGVDFEEILNSNYSLKKIKINIAAC